MYTHMYEALRHADRGAAGHPGPCALQRLRAANETPTYN